MGDIPIGQVFSYEIRYESNVLSVNLNDGDFLELPTYSSRYPSKLFQGWKLSFQGTTASDIHFFSIDVTHSSTPATPTWPPAGATTSPRSGIGPFNIMTAIDHTVSSAPLPVRQAIATLRPRP